MLPLTLVRTAGLPLNALSSLGGDFDAECLALSAAETVLETTAAALRSAFDDALEDLPDIPLRTDVYNARRMFFTKKRLPAALPETFPTAVLSAARQWKSAGLDLQAAREQLASRYAAVLQDNMDALKIWSNDVSFRRSLLFASHDLLNQISDFQHNKSDFSQKKQRRLALSLAKYISRGAAKTSPFSRLTTLSLFRPGQENGEAPPGAWQSARAVVSPNVALLPFFYEALLKTPSFYHALPLAVNPSLFIEENGQEPPKYKWLYFDGVQESFQHMNVHPLVAYLLSEMARAPGPVLFGELVALLDKMYQGPPGEREAIVGELIDTGLLEWQWPERGFSPSWCGALYQFLGFLPGAEPLVVDAAALLQWLRTAARVLPHQEEAQALETLSETMRQVHAFFERYGIDLPGIAAEQLFYEDVETEVQAALPEEALQHIVRELKDCWQRSPMHRQTPLKARLHAFARQIAGDSPPLDFMAFCEAFIREKEQVYQQNKEDSALFSPRFSGKIGALIQVFRENDQWRAVVNGLFPGGGKLWARWQHLFPASAQKTLAEWWPADAAPFPWQHWSNTSFHSQPGNRHLAVPGGRSPGGKALRLNGLSVVVKAHDIFLYDRQIQRQINFVDLGLEAPDTRPPVVQILWHLGSPRVSKEVLLDGGNRWERLESGALFRPRQESGALVLERAAWQIAVPNAPREPLAAFLFLRGILEQHGAPKRFFARFPGEKPQYIDRDSPVLMQLLFKKLHQHGGKLFLEEMLPAPEQSIVGHEDKLHAAEFVIEFEV